MLQALAIIILLPMAAASLLFTIGCAVGIVNTIFKR